MISFRNLPEYQVAVKGYKVQISFPKYLSANNTKLFLSQTYYLAKDL